MDVWLVTGGAGFIGSNFVRLALARTPARVVVLDKLTYAGNLESLADVASSPRFHFVRADIADRSAVEQTLREHRPTALLNFAAETHVDRSIDGPGAFVHTNLVGTFTLLEAARRHLAGGARRLRRPAGDPLSKALWLGSRLALGVMRSVPEVVWALVFVRAVGLGPVPGVLAIGVGASSHLLSEDGFGLLTGEAGA